MSEVKNKQSRIPVEDAVAVFRHPIWVAGRLLRVLSAVVAVVGIMIGLLGVVGSNIGIVLIAIGFLAVAVTLRIGGDRFVADAKYAVVNELAGRRAGSPNADS